MDPNHIREPANSRLNYYTWLSLSLSCPNHINTTDVSGVSSTDPMAHRDVGVGSGCRLSILSVCSAELAAVYPRKLGVFLDFA